MKIEMIVAILGLVFTSIPILIMLYNRFIKKPHQIEISFDNAGFSHMINEYKTNTTSRPILFIYGLKFHNRGSKNVTLKSVRLKYKVNRKRKLSEPFPLITGNSDQNDDLALMINTMTGDQIILMGWTNIHKHLSQTLIEPQKVIGASIVFPLEIETGETLRKYIKIIIQNYDGRSTSHKIKLEDPAFQYLGSTKLYNNSFSIQPDDSIEIQKTE